MKKKLLTLFLIFLGGFCYSNNEKTLKGEIKDSIEIQSEVKIPNLASKYVNYIYKTANDLDLPIRIVFRLIQIESKFKTNAISHDGARGMMQIKTKTYNIYRKKLKLDKMKINNNYKYILASMHYLKDIHNHYENNAKSAWEINALKSYTIWELTLATYNAGVGKVRKNKGVPKVSSRYLNYILKEPMELTYSTTN